MILDEKKIFIIGMVRPSKRNCTSASTSREIDMTGVPLSSEIVPIVPKKSGNTKKQISPCRHWCFTLNNYSMSDLTSIKALSSSIVPIITFQEEIGEQGTPHLQGSLTLTNKGRPMSLGLSDKIHWEKKSRYSSMEQFRMYCIKDATRKPAGERYMRGWEPEECYIENIPVKHWHGWMDEAISVLDGPVAWDSIYWYWEYEGGVGKTSFCKYVYTHYKDVLILGGKASDMKYAIAAFKKTNKRLPKIILVDIPRSCMGYVSYQGFEEVKQMSFFSGKYESDNVVGARPHMMCFANEEPEYERLSSRKWEVRHLRNNIYSS